jgi:nucleotide-binding universal stress UspA family protein
MQILICSDGSPAARQAAAIIAALGLARHSKLTLLGVLESRERTEQALKQSLKETASLLGPQAAAEIKIASGEPALEILAEAEAGKYDLVSVGAHGHRGWIRSRLGATTSRLAHELKVPLLIARRVPAELHRILICTAAEQPSMGTIKLGGQIASMARAPVTLLHVMSQVALFPESPADDLEATAAGAIEHGSREGVHLAQALATLRDSNPEGEQPQARLRHGLVVDEILLELENTEYGLLVIGTHYPTGSGRWMDVLLDDITGQLILHAPCSVLIARQNDQA